MLIDCPTFFLVTHDPLQKVSELFSSLRQRNVQSCHVYFQIPHRQPMRVTEKQRQKWMRERDEWKENRADVGVTEARHIGVSVDAYSRTFPILNPNLPVALPSCALPVPVLALGCEPEQLLYTDIPTATAAQALPV